jgi:hypothetical protein
MLPKRIWAMMGVVYFCIIFLLMLYWTATLDLITSITGIMMFPAFGALSAQFFNRRWLIRHGRLDHIEDESFQEPDFPQPGGERELVCGIICGVLSLGTLISGVFQLIAFFQT